MATKPATPAPAPAQPTKSTKSAATVVVACKLPNGLVLQLSKETKYFEDTPGGARERTRFDKFGDRVVVRGVAYPQQPPAGFPLRPMMVGGYALTPGVPADFWDAWYKLHEDTPLIKNAQIFAYTRLADVRDDAKEHSSVRSGFEPLIPDGDPRAPKAIPGMTNIESTDEMKTRLQQAAQLDEAEIESA